MSNPPITCVVFQSGENKVNVLFPTPSYLETHTLEEVIQKDIPAGIPYEITTKDQLPQTPGLSSAWVANFESYQGVSIDLDKAKVIYKQNIDNRVFIESAPLTEEYVRLLAIGGDTSAVTAKLVVLDNCKTNTNYLSATTVDELIACWPLVLGPNPFLPPTLS